MIRTSLSHPLKIAELAVGELGGAIGITFAPGKFQEVAMTGAWARDLESDMAAIRAWGTSHLLSLLEPWEFEDLKIPHLPSVATAHGLTWHGLPIRDGAAPDERFVAQWRVLGPLLDNALLAGQRLVVHCKGGLGRAGTVACMLLLATKPTIDVDEIMSAVRTVRPGAIETLEQEGFLREWAQVLYANR